MEPVLPHIPALSCTRTHCALAPPLWYRLGPTGAVFASKARKKIMEHNVRLPVLPGDVKVEVPSTVVFRGYGTALQATWQETLPEDEEAEVVAVGGDWAAVATSTQVCDRVGCTQHCACGSRGRGGGRGLAPLCMWVQGRGGGWGLDRSFGTIVMV